MKNKLVFTLFAVLLLNIFPLLLQPELIFHYKTIILCVSAAILWLSQPAFRKDEVQEDKKTDKQSILMILVASSASVFISVTEWAYFAGNHDEMNLKTMVGLVLLITGIVIRVWSIRILGRNFTATVKVTEKHSLITSGPYQYIRHPSYLGALIAITGCPLFLNNTFSVVIAACLMLTAYYFRIKFEEKALLHHFGEAYSEYKRHTFGLLPLIW